MSHTFRDHKNLPDAESGRSEEVLAVNLHASHPARREHAELFAFRRLCTSRASKRGARDQRLSRRT